MGRPGLTTHRKFRRLARALGSPMLARGALELLWDACYESGNDYVGTADDVEALIGWMGEPGVLARALVDAGQPEGHGFLEPVSPEAGSQTSFRVHDLFHHAPEYVSNRRTREDERRQPKSCQHCGRTYFNTDPRSQYCSQACRQGGYRNRQNSDGALQKPPSRVTDRDSTPAPAPAPAPITPQEESSAALSATPASSRGLFEVRETPVLVFPTVGKRKEWELWPSLVSEWEGLYPNLDIHAQCRKALAWCRANPRRQKTAQGMSGFLVNWFNRAVSRGETVQRRHAPAQFAAPSEWVCPHTPHCAGRGKCLTLQQIDADKAERRRHA